MNEEFLIEPTGFKSALELKYVLEKFGFFQGRFIGKFPKDWKKQIYQNMDKLPDLEQKRISILLEKNQDCLVPSGQPFDATSPWIKNAHQQVKQKNFEGIIAASSNEWDYPTYSEVDHDYLMGGHDSRILASSKNYTKITQRLLQLSHEIVLVDPYLKLNSGGCEHVLNEFLVSAQQGKCRSFVIWARDKEAGLKTKAAYRLMLEKNYKPRLMNGSQLTVKLVNDDASSQKMHARLMLSKLGGFRFDHGFSEFDADRYVDIAIIDKKTHDGYCHWYLDPGSPNDFEIVEEHFI
jgi:hypothetical protein